jgi:hypothetical protein
MISNYIWLSFIVSLKKYKKIDNIYIL